MAGTSRNTSKDDGVKARVAEEATRLFASKGFAATSIRDIAQAAQVTNPTIYYHFGSKAELHAHLVAVGGEIFQQLLVRVGAPGLSTRDRLITLVDGHFEMVKRNPDLARILLSACFVHRFVDPGPQLDEVIESSECAVLSMIKEAQRQGDMDPALDPEILHSMLSGAFLSPILGYIGGRCLELNRDVATALVDLFLRGAAPQPELHS